MGLVLERRPGEKVRIGIGERKAMSITVLDVRANQVELRLQSKRFDARHVIQRNGDLNVEVAHERLIITLREADRSRCRLDFSAPQIIKIDRQELWEEKHR